MRNINNYEVFKRAHNLTLKIYKITKNYPKEERYGLISQMRRAVYSIPMNLKEGSFGSEAEFFKYVRISIGSKEELDYQLLLSKDLGYISEKDWKVLLNELDIIGKMLFKIVIKKNNK